MFTEIIYSNFLLTYFHYSSIIYYNSIGIQKLKRYYYLLKFIYYIFNSAKLHIKTTC